MSMSNTEGITPLDISMLNVQSSRPEWAKIPDNSDNPYCEKDPEMAETTMQNDMFYSTVDDKV